MNKKKKNKKIKKTFIKFLKNLKKQVELIPPKYWNKHF
jgi:hypothetical protein